MLLKMQLEASTKLLDFFDGIHKSMNSSRESILEKSHIYKYYIGLIYLIFKSIMLQAKYCRIENIAIFQNSKHIVSLKLQRD